MVKLIEEIQLSKEEKKALDAYRSAMGKAIAVMKGDDKFRETKTIPQDQVDAVIDELIEEQVKDKKEEFKTRMKSLFKKRVEFERLVEQKQREFNKTIVEKMKEFTKEANDTIGILGNISDIVKTYKESFNAADTQAAENAATEEGDKEEE